MHRDRTWPARGTSEKPPLAACCGTGANVAGFLQEKLKSNAESFLKTRCRTAGNA